jgi:hypothetical protein
MAGPRPTDEYQEPPDDALPAPEPPVAVPAAVIASTLQTLNLFDEFFRLYASTPPAPNYAPSPHCRAGTRSRAPKPSSRASAWTPSDSPGPATRCRKTAFRHRHQQPITTITIPAAQPRQDTPDR